MPHESLYDIQDAKRLIRDRAVDLLGLKLDRPGGITNARVAYKMAELFNIPCTVISSVELGISTSAAMMFAASLKTLEYACEASGTMTISDDVVREPLVLKNGCAEVPTGPGLGVELDEKKIDKYNQGTVICK
jgi:L-alanine-DL-glutamate epimerase-like enolase superfamily enzyme